VLTAVVGYLLAARGDARLTVLAWTAIGTALSAFGANILNQLLEADRDGLMERTRGRPLPSRRVARREAVAWGIASAAAGLAVLAAGTNLLTAGLSLFTILLYVLVYTPLKVRTPFNTAIGAVCGAVPPMMGWTAGAGRLELGAWILFGILFFWQVPHFLSLAWLYRADYERGGFRMMPSIDRDGDLTGRLAVLYAAALLPITAALSWTGLSGTVFLVSSQLLGIGLAAVGWRFLRMRSQTAARRLFLASIVYLPLLMLLMVGDRTVPPPSARHETEARVVTAVEASTRATGPTVRF
jgi:protoheme IX farnesyltransferase